MGTVLDSILRRASGHAVEERSMSIGDPSWAHLFGFGLPATSGQSVTESTSLGLTSVWRAVSLISGAIAALPLKTYRELPDGSRERVGSFLDDPGAAVGMTRFTWVETVLGHLLLHGNSFLEHVHSGAGAVMGLRPIHPSSVEVNVDIHTGAKTFTVTYANGSRREFSPLDLTHVLAFTTDGIRGLSPITVARNAIGAGLAADEAAARQFRSGLMLGGVVASDENLDQEQARQIKDSFESKLGGARHAGEVLVTNASLKFSPWQQTAEDAQFIESRAFQIDEVARLFGVPREMLSASGATSWGSGISELVRGFQRFTLAPWTSRLEESLSLLLARPRFVEFDYAGLLQPDETAATANLIAEVNAGTLTIDEARRIKNRPALTATPDPEVP